MVPAAVPTGDGIRPTGRRTPVGQGLPHLPVGNGATRHHDGTVNEGDIDGRAVGGIVRRSQHQVEGIGTITDRHAGPGRQTFEPGPKEGSAGDDADGGGRLHGSRMAPSRSPVLVRNDPFPGGRGGRLVGEATQANRTIVALLMSWRVSGLVTGLAAVVAGRRRYRSQSAAVGQLVAVGAESVWLARHLRGNAYRFDRRALTVDLVTAVAALRSAGGNLDPDDRWTWIDWVPWSFATNAVAGRAVAGDVPMAGALGATVIVGTGASLAGGGATDWSTPGAWPPTSPRPRLSSARFARAGPASRRPGPMPSTRAAGWPSNRSGRGSCGSSTTARSRRWRQSAPDGTGIWPPSDHWPSKKPGGSETSWTARPPTGPLREELEALVDGHARRGLDIDLQMRTTTEPSPPVLLALRDACHEALVNVGKHAGGHRALVVAGDDTGGITVTVEDDGTGFDPSLGTGFGTTRSIVGRMAEVGGRARIESAPGRTGPSVGTGMISVVIVDDHPVYRQGLAMAVDRAPDLELAGEARSIEDFDRLDARPDVVLLDLHLPGIEGSVGVAHVCDQGHRVVVVSAAGTRRRRRRHRRRGVRLPDQGDRRRGDHPRRAGRGRRRDLRVAHPGLLPAAGREVHGPVQADRRAARRLALVAVVRRTRTSRPSCRSPSPPSTPISNAYGTRPVPAAERS